MDYIDIALRVSDFKYVKLLSIYYAFIQTISEFIFCDISESKGNEKYCFRACFIFEFWTYF